MRRIGLIAVLITTIVLLIGLLWSGPQRLLQNQTSDPVTPATPVLLAITPQATLPATSLLDTDLPNTDLPNTSLPDTPLPNPPPSTDEPIPSTVEQPIADILANMSIEEKVGQLFLVWFEGPALSPALEEMIRDYHVGGLVLFSSAGNIESPAQLAALLNDAQAAAEIPLLVAVDQEGGPVVRLTDGFTVFPSQMAVGAANDSELAAEMAQVMAAEMQAVGVNMVLGPVMDVNNNPDNPVIGIRSFSSDPQRVSILGSAMIQAYEEFRLIATAKHFPGHGDTDVDSHFGLPIIPHSREHLDEIELPPFRAATAQNVPAIMTAHVILSAIDPARPATLSPAVLTDLLREEMGYDGLIVTDSLGMGALTQDFGGGVPDAGGIGLLAFQAGADVLAYGKDFGATIVDQQTAYARILAAVQSGEVSEERLDASVRRILAAKMVHGLFERQPVDPSQAEGLTGTDAHQAVAQAVAEASVTLVQDRAGLVPIDQTGQMMVIYPDFLPGFGEALASCRPDLILRPVPLNPTLTDIEQITLDADLAATVMMGTYNARRHPAQVELAQGLPPDKLIVVGLNEPYDLLAFPKVPAYIATYGTVDASMQALARVLCGEVTPLGALPVALPGLYPLGQRYGDRGILFLPITQVQ